MSGPWCGKREDHDQRRQSKEGMTVGLRDIGHDGSKQAQSKILMLRGRLSICFLFLRLQAAEMEGCHGKNTMHQKFMLKAFSRDSNLPQSVRRSLVRERETGLRRKMMQQFKISHLEHCMRDRICLCGFRLGSRLSGIKPRCLSIRAIEL